MHDPSKNKRSSSNASASIEDSDDELSKTNESNLINAYSTLKEPPAKKFKDDQINENAVAISTNESPKRNPFKVTAGLSSHLTELLSPTKITRENSSLIRNQSPVKRIEYPTPSPVKRMDYKKLEKLSRFQRTAVSNKKNVISRFFCNSTSTIVKTEKTDDDDNKALKTDATNIVQIIKTNVNNDNDNEMETVSSKSNGIKVESTNMLYLKMSTAINRSNSNGLERERTPERDDTSLSGSTGTTANSQPIFEDDDFIGETDSLSCSVQEILPERPLIVIEDDDDDDESVEVGAEERYNLEKQASRLISPSMISKHLNVCTLLYILLYEYSLDFIDSIN